MFLLFVFVFIMLMLLSQRQMFDERSKYFVTVPHVNWNNVDISMK